MSGVSDTESGQEQKQHRTEEETVGEKGLRAVAEQDKEYLVSVGKRMGKRLSTEVDLSSPPEGEKSLDGPEGGSSSLTNSSSPSPMKAKTSLHRTLSFFSDSIPKENLLHS